FRGPTWHWSARSPSVRSPSPASAPSGRRASPPCGSCGICSARSLWGLVSLLRTPRLAEQATDLVLGHRLKVESCLAHDPHESSVALSEPSDRATKGRFRVHSELARHRHRREEHVAELLLGVPRITGPLELVDLLAQCRHRALDAPPLQPPAGGAALDLRRTCEGRQGRRDLVLHPVLAFLLGLD